MLQSGLIGMTREASRDPKNPLGFGGISALYVPVPGTEVDTYITGNLYKATYNNLQFVLDTGWPGTEQIP
jgi:hypothetical protein